MSWFKSSLLTLAVMFSSFVQANCVSFNEWQQNTNNFLAQFTRQAEFFYVPELSSFKLVNKGQQLYKQKINFSEVSFNLDNQKKCIVRVNASLVLDSKELGSSLDELMQMAEDLIPINNSYVNNFTSANLLEEQYAHVASHFYNNYKAPANEKKNPLIFVIKGKEFKFVFTQKANSLHYSYSVRILD